jgi:hypothetical protein
MNEKKDSQLSEKLVRVLKKMNETLCKEGYFQYQERFLRIHKTFLSLEKHEDCQVSVFELENIESNSLSQFENNSSMNKADEKNIEIDRIICQRDQGEDYSSPVKSEEKKMGLPDLLDFIEAELRNQDDSTLIQSDSSMDEAYSNYEYKMNRAMENIRKRLKEYLREEHSQIFLKDKDGNNMTYANYGSFLCESKQKSGMKKMASPCTYSLPSIRKNFFDDKSILEVARKRYSVREDQMKSQLAELEEIHKCRSHWEKLSYATISGVTSGKNNSSKDSSGGIGISNFNLDTLETSSCFIPQVPSFKRRASIFKERFEYDSPIIEAEEIDLISNGNSSESD